MTKNEFESIRTGDLVVPLRGELKGCHLEVTAIYNDMLEACVIDEAVIKRKDGAKIVFPDGYSVSGLYQMFKSERGLRYKR